MTLPSMADAPFHCPPDDAPAGLSVAAKSALHEVLLQAAIRAERLKSNVDSDQRVKELARRMDQRARTR